MAGLSDEKPRRAWRKALGMILPLPSMICIRLAFAV
jgi:hypothetical protein